MADAAITPKSAGVNRRATTISWIAAITLSNTNPAPAHPPAWRIRWRRRSGVGSALSCLTWGSAITMSRLVIMLFAASQ